MCVVTCCLQDQVSHLSGPLSKWGSVGMFLERRIRQAATEYARNVTSVLCSFPATTIACIIDTHLRSLNRADRAAVNEVLTRAPSALRCARVLSTALLHFATLLHSILFFSESALLNLSC